MLKIYFFINILIFLWFFIDLEDIKRSFEMLNFKEFLKVYTISFLIFLFLGIFIFFNYKKERAN